jgi:hypothetical protein
MENPAIVGGPDETTLTYEYTYDEDDEDAEPTQSGTLLDFIEAIKDEAGAFEGGDTEGFTGSLLEYALDYGGIGLTKLRKMATDSEQFGYYQDDEGNLANHEILRRALQRIGFDGIIDKSVNKHFGSRRKWGRSMAGIDEDSVHYIVFDPKQIKSAIGHRAFNPRSPKFTEARRRP